MLSDPRVFFAAERTLLAWVRTGLTVMAFGFVVARFGLFLRLLAAQSGSQPSSVTTRDLSNIVGIVMVLLGVGCMIVGAIQYKSYVSTLPAADVPRTHRAVFPISLALILAALGLVLAIYLAFPSPVQRRPRGRSTNGQFIDHENLLAKIADSRWRWSWR